MKPYYEKDGITIYHGDCREILPALPKSDLLLTDPPYGIGEAAGKNRTRVHATIPKDYGNDSWDDEPTPRDLLDLAIGSAQQAVIFGGNYFGLPASPCWLVWDKDNTGDFADCELAWTNLAWAVRRIRYRWNGMIQEHGGVAKEPRFHPTQKPVAVMAWALKVARITSGTVLDPFMGSGTTLVAARAAGLRAIGVEREERYCEIAAKRLAQGVFDFSKGPDR